MVKESGVIAFVIAASIVITGCAPLRGDATALPSRSSTPTPTRSASATASVPSIDVRGLTSAPTGVVDEDTGEIYVPEVVAVWDEQSRAAVITAAETAMRAFARPDLSFEQWWEAMEPLLEQGALRIYSYVDPANIPVTQVTGAAVIIDDTSAYVAKVAVPTNVGNYTLILSRADGNSAWLTSKFTPPDGVN
ncbi:MAG: hypothetical protein ACRCSP_06940 [Rhodoglobus sp.]